MTFHPLNVGQVFKEAFALYKRLILILLPIAVAIFAILSFLSAYATHINHSGWGQVLAVLVSIAGATLFQGVAVEVVREVKSQREVVAASHFIPVVLKRLHILIAVSVLAGLFIALGSILLIIPGLIVATILAVVAPVVIVEKTGVFKAFSRSRELVNNSGWQVFAVIILMIVLSVVISILLLFAFQGNFDLEQPDFWDAWLSSMITAIIISPVQALVVSAMYFQLVEVRKQLEQ